MAGRFSSRRATPEFSPAEDAVPAPAEGLVWTVFPEASPAPLPVAVAAPAPAPPPPAFSGSPPSAASSNPLLSDKLLDAKVRLHRRLIEEINLSALEKLPEEEIRKHVQQLVSQYILVERLALNAQELAVLVTEILAALTGPGPIAPRLKGRALTELPLNSNQGVLAARRRRL